RNPVTGFRIAHEFILRAIGLRFDVGAKHLLRSDDLLGAVHEINGDGGHLALVVKHLASFFFIEDVEILLITLVGWTAEFFADVIRNPSDLNSTIFVKDRIFLWR